MATAFNPNLQTDLRDVKAQGASVGDSRTYNGQTYKWSGVNWEGSGGGSSSGGGNLGGTNYEDILKRTQQMNQEANKPVVSSLQSSIPEIQNKYATQKTQLEAEKEPLKARYENVLAQIKGQGTSAVNRQTTITSNELGKRGLSGDSTLAQQEISNAVSPLELQYATMGKDTELARESDLRNLVNQITGLTTQETEQTRGVQNAIAQILSGGNTNATTQALSILQNNQQQQQYQAGQELQKQQFAMQQAQQAADEAFRQKQLQESTRQFNAQEGRLGTKDTSLQSLLTNPAFKDILGTSTTKKTTQGTYIPSIGKSVVGYAADGRAVYSDGTMGWSNAKKK